VVQRKKTTPQIDVQKNHKNGGPRGRPKECGKTHVNVIQKEKGKKADEKRKSE